MPVTAVPLTSEGITRFVMSAPINDVISPFSFIVKSLSPSALTTSIWHSAVLPLTLTVILAFPG